MGYRKRTNAKGEPRWEVYWTFLTVHRRRKTLSCTVIAPHNAARERQYEAELIEKTKSRTADTPDEDMTAAQLVERWLQQHEDGWSPGQANEQRARAENHVLPALGAKRINAAFCQAGRSRSRRNRPRLNAHPFWDLDATFLQLCL